jgi:hypothetical protein
MGPDFMRKIGRESRFPPGQSGNPNGRPKKRRALAEVLRDVLDGDTLLGMKTSEIYRQIGKGPSVDDDPSVARLVVEAAVGHFIAKGNPAILANIVERVDGPSKAVESEPIEPLTCDEDAVEIFKTIDRIRARKEGREPTAWDDSPA